MTQLTNLIRRRSRAIVVVALFASFAQAQTPPQGPPRENLSPAQTPTPPQPGTVRPTTMTTGVPPVQLSSSQYIDPAGQTVEQLIEAGFTRRADLLAARQRLSIARGRLLQAGLRPNPVLDSEYTSARILGGQNEGDFSVGVSQLFETGGKRSKRVTVARLELAQVQAEVRSLERQFAADLRAAYARALAAARQLDTEEKLIAANEEIVRVTTARLNEGDVAPLDLNLVRVETDRLRAQTVRTRADLEGQLISIRTFAGFEVTEPLRIAPLPEKPPRLDLSLPEATDMALRERADLQAARLGEEVGSARIQLAQAQAVPNLALTSRYSIRRDIFDDTPVGILRDKDRLLTFGVSVDIPVFNRNQGEIASAVGEKSQAQRQREFLEATIKRDVALAYRRYRAASEALVLYATQIIPTAEKNVQAVRAAYTAGEFSVFDVVAEQRRLIENETAYNESLGESYTSLAELERALGITLPPSAFAPGTITVIPDVDRLTGGKLVQSIKSTILMDQPEAKGGKLPLSGPPSTNSQMERTVPQN
jgi:cobalt-zinc-cadmium efflux system outer membrane protein